MRTSSWVYREAHKNSEERGIVFMELLRHIRQSVYDPEYYREIPAQPLSHSIKYFYSLTLVIAIVLTVVYGFMFTPPLLSFLRSLGPSVLNYYPDELVITIKKGTASTNVTEPYKLPLPESFKLGRNKDVENLLVIDTQHSFSMDQWKEYNTYAWLTRDTLIYRSDQGDLRLMALDRVPATEITKKELTSWIEAINALFKFVPPLLVLGIFLVMMVILSTKLLYLFLGALLILAIARWKKVNLSYKKAYQIGLHAITLGMIYELIKLAIFPGSPSIPFFFTILMCLVAWFNLRPEEEVHPHT